MKILFLKNKLEDFSGLVDVDNLSSELKKTVN